MVLTKEDFLARRKKGGALVPVEVELEDGSGCVAVHLLTLDEIGQLAEDSKKSDTDSASLERLKALLESKLAQPRFTCEELGKLPMKDVLLMANALLRGNQIDPKK